MIFTRSAFTLFFLVGFLLWLKPLAAQNIDDANDYAALDFSLSSMVLFALHDNPDVALAKEAENQAAFTINEARAALYPSLTVAAEQNLQYNNPAAGKPAKKSNINLGNEINFNFQQLLFDGFTSSSTVDRRRKERDATAIGVDIATKDIVSETVEYYIAIYRDQQILKDLERFLDQINEITKKVELMEQEGASSQVKVAYAQSRLSSAKTQFTEIVSTLNDAISNLEFLTGKLPPFRAQRPDELVLEGNSLQQFIDYAYAHNSELLENAASYDAVESNVKAKKGAFYPNVTFNIDGSRKHDDAGEIGPTTELVAAFRMDYQLLDIMGRKASVNKAKSQANALLITDQKIRKELKRDIRQLYNQMTSSQRALMDTENEIASNEQLQKLNRENFEYGDIDIIELIEGEERLINSRRQKYTLEAELYQNAYDLLLLVGYLDEGYFCENC